MIKYYHLNPSISIPINNNKDEGTYLTHKIINISFEAKQKLIKYIHLHNDENISIIPHFILNRKFSKSKTVDILTRVLFRLEPHKTNKFITPSDIRSNTVLPLYTLKYKMNKYEYDYMVQSKEKCVEFIDYLYKYLNFEFNVANYNFICEHELQFDDQDTTVDFILSLSIVRMNDNKLINFNDLFSLHIEFKEILDMEVPFRTEIYNNLVNPRNSYNIFNKEIRLHYKQFKNSSNEVFNKLIKKENKK